MNWYHEGLCFQCQKCGKCCTGSPGYVWLSEKDIFALSSHLHMSKEEFLKKYTRNVQGRISLLEKTPSYDCIFLRDNKCFVYTVRPIQCQTFPFWPSSLENKTSWDALSSSCPGVNSSEEKIPESTILEKLFSYLKNFSLVLYFLFPNF